MDLQKNDFPPDGCPVIDQDGTVCGETRTLNIIQEFKRLYKEKMQEIDQQTDGGGDNLQEKLKLQEQWINDLTDQNEMLVKAVEELEVEAAQRVNLLEEKLQQSAKCICEVMKKYREHDFTSDLLDEPLQKLFYKENDLKNLLLYLKRIRETGDWSVDGLTFYDVTRSDLLGQEEEESSKKDEENPLERESEEKMQQKVSEKERIVEDLKCRLDYNKDLAMELKRKSEELESVKLAMADIRQVLTEEVAAKHDVILSLKKDCAQLEERCQVAAKQVTFKDDIIKELRKEIKQLKQQMVPDQDFFEFQKQEQPKAIITVNHNKSPRKPSKSKIILVSHSSSRKSSKTSSNETFTISNHNLTDFKDTSVCPHCKNNNNNEKLIEKPFVHVCKSENDLHSYHGPKERSILTAPSLSRGKTFIDMPQHIPVRKYVNNIESASKNVDK